MAVTVIKFFKAVPACRCSTLNKFTLEQNIFSSVLYHFTGHGSHAVSGMHCLGSLGSRDHWFDPT
jgi:heme/copper-type cytochrome/quinol oxidase subunit 3